MGSDRRWLSVGPTCSERHSNIRSEISQDDNEASANFRPCAITTCSHARGGGFITSQLQAELEGAGGRYLRYFPRQQATRLTWEVPTCSTQAVEPIDRSLHAYSHSPKVIVRKPQTPTCQPVMKEWVMKELNC